MRCENCGRISEECGCVIDAEIMRDVERIHFDAVVEMTLAEKREPDPVKSDAPAAWDLVIQDMRQRDEFGHKKYGVRLQPNNGRDQLVDAYQEALDLCVYLRAAIYERDGR